MEKQKKSPIQISEISLNEIIFKKRGTRLKRTKILPSAINFEVQIQEIDTLSYTTRCKINVYDEAEQSCDFYLKLEYNIISRIIDPEFKNALEGFAKLGAPFNALVHAREIVSSLTSRAFGKVALLPLLDIRDFEQRLEIKVLEKQHEGKKEPSKTGEFTTKSPE